MTSTQSGSKQSEDCVAVVGAGLTGGLLAILLARQGFRVDLLEKRDLAVNSIDTDESAVEAFGNATNATKRSINLALSFRGREALRAAGLHDQVMKYAIPMKERAIHGKDGSMHFQPYGSHGECIYSVSRELLNRTLVATATSEPLVSVKCGVSIVRVDKDGTVTFKDESGESHQKKYRTVFGADGAYSKVRASLLRLSRANFSQQYISHGYKELTITAKPNGEFRMDPVGALHIWPRHEFMLIALPNPDGTFTCTLFAPYDLMDELQSETDIMQFFEENFPDLLPLIPDMVAEYRANPVGSLVTVKVDPWHYKDRVLLLGDAAHAIVPFYGQGMNAGFEDVLFFNEVLTNCDGQLSVAVPRFATERKPAGDGIAELSFRNYVEMRSHTASLAFLWKKRFEAVLHRLFPGMWIPLYTMVAFTRIPYHKAIAKAERQDRILSWAVGSSALALVGLVGWQVVKNAHRIKFLDRWTK